MGMNPQTAWIVLALLLIAGAIPRPKPERTLDHLTGWAWTLLFAVVMVRAALAI